MALYCSRLSSRRELVAFVKKYICWLWYGFQSALHYLSALVVHSEIVGSWPIICSTDPDQDYRSDQLLQCHAGLFLARTRANQTLLMVGLLALTTNCAELILWRGRASACASFPPDGASTPPTRRAPRPSRPCVLARHRASERCSVRRCAPAPTPAALGAGGARRTRCVPKKS